MHVDALVIAKKNKCVLQIGHLEQFNPAIRRLRKNDFKPQFIEVHRLCQFNPRANDVDVVLGALTAANQEVIGLDISVNDSFLVHFLNALNLE